VFARTFSSRIGFPDLTTLDSTDPGAVKQALDRVNVPRALFVVSSTSGASAETLALYRLCRERVDAAAVTKPGSQFVAITDPGTPLADLAREGGFRHTFLNPASIGDRYAALSYVGAVPAVLLGVDLRTLLERARTMVEQSGNGVSAHESAPVRLGAALAAFARSGRDKVTLVLSEKIRALGPWLELLLAESLGKEGRGVVPIVDEPLGAPAVYGPDRLFVALLLEEDDSHDAALDALADAGHPVIRITLNDALDVGAEFFRWELATATAGAVLGVNPFDAPDAPLATDHATRLLAQWLKTRRLPEWKADVEEAGIALITGADPTPASVAQGIASHLARARPGDYLAIQAHLEPNAEIERQLQTLRALLRDRLRIATTLGFAPRYLHATGQLHKGGPPSGLFIQITGQDTAEVAIPGAGYDFATFNAAQAMGDFEALRERERRIIRVHVQGKPAQTLQQLLQIVRAATRNL
jgi:hypothetical protein